VRSFQGYPAHALIAGLALLLTLSMRLALSERYRLERRQIEAVAAKQRSRDVADGWNRQSFSAPTRGKLGDAFVRAIDWQRLALSDVQKARLDSRLREILNYLQSPSLDEYYRLKTEALSWKFQLGESARRRLGLAEPGPATAAELQPLDAVGALWDAVRRLNNKTGAPPRLTAVCLEGIRIATSQTNSPSAVLLGQIAKGFTIAQEATDPGFTYAPQALSDIADRRQEVFVFLGFLARSDVSEDAGPLYISLYWSEDDQNWALSRLFTDVLLKMNLLF